MKVNILLCDWFEGLLPDFVTEFPEMVYAMVDAVAQEPVAYKVYDVQRGEQPERIDGGELYLITGSMAGAYEDKPWIHSLAGFVRRAAAAGAAMAGICFGHQMVAQALGGRVEPSPKGWGAGIRASRVVMPEAAAYFPTGEMRLFYNHHDQVVELPPRARLIATSEFCPIEAFAIGERIVCFQGHPEYTAAYEAHVVDTAKGEPEAVIEAARASTLRDDAMSAAAARWIVDTVSR